MTPKTVKFGDKFKLCGFIWEVIVTLNGGTVFQAIQCGASMNSVTLTMMASEAMGCEWIEPEVRKLTKEQAEMIKKEWNGSFEFFSWLDSITEKE